MTRNLKVKTSHLSSWFEMKFILGMDIKKNVPEENLVGSKEYVRGYLGTF